MKITRRTKLLIVALALCITTMVGSTFAWFTDEVTSANNVIEAGNLDVELYYQNAQSSWTKVDANTNVFKTNTLWEPGYTEVVKLKVVNEGNLALKYNLGANVASEIPSTNVLGADFNLSDYIKVGFVKGALNGGRDQAIAAVDATAEFLKDGKGTALYALNPAAAGTNNNEQIFTMVVYMPTTVGNEANHAKDAATPKINLGLKLLATQQTAEEDSFDNQYDKDAAWNGIVPTKMPGTLVVDGDTQTVHVKDAAAFAYLSTLSAKWAELYTDGQGTEYGNYANGEGAEYYYSGQWTVSLESDIDLCNYPIDPVVIKFGASTGASTFKGNNHVIRNINTTTGLFANNNWAEYADLTLENVKATNGALAGSANTNISNVTVKNATISGVNYVGGLVGYLYGDITGCQVSYSSVTASGEDAGGLAGYTCQEGGSYLVANNKVQNVSVYANVRAAGLIATANITGEVCNNILDNVVVVAAADDTDGHKADILISWKLVGTVHDNTVNNCKVGREVYGLTLIPNGENSQIIVNDKEGFLNLTKLFNDWTALFTDGNGNEILNYTSSDYYYGGYWTISLEADIDLNNKTIAPVTIKHPVSAGAPTFAGNNHTISNAKIVTDATTENEAGLFNANSVAFKNLKLDNIRVTGSNVGNSTAGVLLGTCNAPVSNITITNSSVNGGKYTGGVVGYGYTDITNCTLTNVTVKGGYKLGGIIGYICANNDGTGDVTGNSLTGCTVDGIGDGVYAGGKDKYIIGQVVGNYNGNGTCKNTVTDMTSSVTVAIGEIEAGWTVTQ